MLQSLWVCWQEECDGHYYCELNIQDAGGAGTALAQPDMSVSEIEIESETGTSIYVSYIRPHWRTGPLSQDLDERRDRVG